MYADAPAGIARIARAQPGVSRRAKSPRPSAGRGDQVVGDADFHLADNAELVLEARVSGSRKAVLDREGGAGDLPAQAAASNISSKRTTDLRTVWLWAPSKQRGASAVCAPHSPWNTILMSTAAREFPSISLVFALALGSQP